jgi:ParB/RepB/Spo0J family partition protein
VENQENDTKDNEGTLAWVPITQLKEPKILLRRVNKDSVEYLEMCDSVREQGLLQPILVRPVDDYYEVVEGNYRFTCAKEALLESIPCLIREMTDDEVLVAQLQANAIRPDTTPEEYALRLKRILKANPGMTQAELACLIRKSPYWVSNTLGLLKLRKPFRKMVNRGEIPLANAYRLATIPDFMQKDFVEQAQVMSAIEFHALAGACVKHFQEAIKQGRMEAFYSAQFTPQAHLRPLKEIEKEIEAKDVGALVCAGEDCRNILDGFYAGLRWASHLDQHSIREQEDTIKKRKEREVLDEQR